MGLPALGGLTYRANLKLNTKVLDSVQCGGPDLTVDSTIFEMWMGL